MLFCYLLNRNREIYKTSFSRVVDLVDLSKILHAFSKYLEKLFGRYRGLCTILYISFDTSILYKSVNFGMLSL